MATNDTQKQADHFTGTYLYAVGRRKTAVAQVRLYPAAENADVAHMVNGKALDEYFAHERLRKEIFAPLEAAGKVKDYVISVIVRGGGVTGQVEATRHGIARALVVGDAAMRPILKAAGYLRRDPRQVERKKPGLRKARRATQWRKR